MTITITKVAAFTDADHGGNPAGVVLDADALTAVQKQQIAARAGFSETAFISKSLTAGFKLDFFTPTRQIAHCGHATIGAFSHLAQIGRVGKGKTSKETIDGNREIFIGDKMAFMEQKAAVYTNIDSEIPNILRSLQLTEMDLAFGMRPMLANTGNSFFIIPLKEASALAKIKPDFEAITALSEQYDLVGFYAYASDPMNETDATTRMFAPRYGIEEESATGMAAGPLAAYLFDFTENKKEHYQIRQGVYMTHPSQSLLLATLELEKGKIVRLFVGGKGKAMGETTIEIG